MNMNIISIFYVKLPRVNFLNCTATLLGLTGVRSAVTVLDNSRNPKYFTTSLFFAYRFSASMVCNGDNVYIYSCNQDLIS